MCTLTHHKKSVRAMALHPKELVPTGSFFKLVSTHGFMFSIMYIAGTFTIISLV